jgi:hypothetical protein
VNYGVLFETMVRAWAKSRMSSAGSTVTLEAFAFSFARRCVCSRARQAIAAYMKQ